MNYHFIGIGGSGMSPLANIMLDRGERVTGSDMEESGNVRKLKDKGATVFIGHSKENLPQDVDVVVVTPAIPASNPELEKAKKLNKKVIQRSELLGNLMALKKGIAISGTHGKTTTSSLIALVLKRADLDPIAVVGGEIQSLNTSYLSGEGDYFEYNRSFLDIKPFGAIITNVEADHLDYFKDLGDIIEAFSSFVGQIQKDGFLVINGDSEVCRHIAERAKCQVFFVGFGISNDYKLGNVKSDNKGVKFNINHDAESSDIQLGVSGKHNAFNAATVFAASKFLNINVESVKSAFKDFKGAKRRLDKISDNPVVYDDYGHHPTEIEATISALREMYPNKKICCIFQPHQFSRTALLIKEFSKALRAVDRVIIPNIYESRDSEKDKNKVSASMLVDAINNEGGNAEHIEDFDKIIDDAILNNRNDVIVTMGAGDVWKIAKGIKESINEKK